MRWKGARSSSNVEDRRGGGVSRGMKGGGLGVIILALVAMYFGIDPSLFLNQGAVVTQGPSTVAPGPVGKGQEDELAQFVSVVLADTEDTWHALFRGMGMRYEEPTLVLFSGSVRSACGFAEAAMGPFYCPGDQKVYIDLGFYRDLKTRHQSPGDFAQAYVIAHEIGHHVQNLLGISDKVEQLRRRVGKADANRLSVMLELQADCLAGVWANHADRTRQILERGDIREALNAASNIGDDRLQKQSRGYVTPESFTHGTSEQRVRWFTQGIRSGELDSCDTFAEDSL